MEPLDDKVSGNSETKLGLEQSVRECAYALWDEEGGRRGEYWHRALDQHLRERAHVLWQQGGSVEGGPARIGIRRVSSNPADVIRDTTKVPRISRTSQRSPLIYMVRVERDYSVCLVF
jgi:hypothetical protein